MSTLRCKPGDMALVHAPEGGFGNGKLVTCLRLSLTDPRQRNAWNLLLGPIWEVDTPLPWRSSATFEVYDIPFCPDKYLVPIRGDLAEEQMIKERMQWTLADIVGAGAADPSKLKIVMPKGEQR